MSNKRHNTYISNIYTSSDDDEDLLDTRNNKFLEKRNNKLFERKNDNKLFGKDDNNKLLNDLVKNMSTPTNVISKPTVITNNFSSNNSLRSLQGVPA